MLLSIVLKVYYRPCSTLSCETNLQFDGRDIGILFMGKFALSYDVIRDYMFHFLEGRLDFFIVHTRMHFCAISALLLLTNTSPYIHTVHSVFSGVWLDT